MDVDTLLIAIAITLFFLLAAGVCLWLAISSRKSRDAEGFTAATLTTGAQSWVNPMQCIHSETGYKFDTELLVRDPSDPVGDACMLNNDGLGLLSDRMTSCALTPDGRGWSNLLTLQGCDADDACSKVLLVRGGNVIYQGEDLTPWGDPSCMLSFHPSAGVEDLTAFETSLKNNVGALSALDVINGIKGQVSTLQGTIASDTNLLVALRGQLDEANSSTRAYSIQNSSLHTSIDADQVEIASLEAKLAALQNQQTTPLSTPPLSPQPQLPSVTSGTLSLWLDATTFSKDGDKVSIWRDGSTNGYSFLQSSQGSQPTVATNVLNSKPGVKFAGAQYVMASGYGQQFCTTNTLFFVVSGISGANVGGVLIYKGNSPDWHNRGEIKVWMGDGTNNDASAGNCPMWVGNAEGYFTNSVAINPAGTVVCMQTNSSSSMTYYMNNVVVTNSTTTNFGNGDDGGYHNLYVGGPAGVYTPMYKGYIHEIIQYNNSLSGTDVATINKYLMSKWGIVAAPTKPTYYHYWGLVNSPGSDDGYRAAAWEAISSVSMAAASNIFNQHIQSFGDVGSYWGVGSAVDDSSNSYYYSANVDWRYPGWIFSGNPDANAPITVVYS